MPNATFSAIVPSDRKIACATKPIVFCHERRFVLSMMASSTFKWPSFASIKPINISMSVDLPEPDGPAMPMTLLTGISIFSLFKIGLS